MRLVADFRCYVPPINVHLAILFSKITYYEPNTNRVPEMNLS